MPSRIIVIFIGVALSGSPLIAGCSGGANGDGPDGGSDGSAESPIRELIDRNRGEVEIDGVRVTADTQHIRSPGRAAGENAVH
jgi:hypothetical protein